ncbi:hypothetical protein [Streptomyces sp. NPDC050504]|uniref:hypothetical protein n=1 Tax=Streptomyces sp. NPDC050504 TaxID=3365618 RepID=UPI00378F1725
MRRTAKALAGIAGGLALAGAVTVPAAAATSTAAVTSTGTAPSCVTFRHSNPDGLGYLTLTNGCGYDVSVRWVDGVGKVSSTCFSAPAGQVTRHTVWSFSWIVGLNNC